MDDFKSVLCYRKETYVFRWGMDPTSEGSPVTENRPHSPLRVPMDVKDVEKSRDYSD